MFQINFEFCSDCGNYLAPTEGTVIDRDGQKVVLCRSCENQSSENLVSAFVKKYKLETT